MQAGGRQGKQSAKSSCGLLFHALLLVAWELDILGVACIVVGLVVVGHMCLMQCVVGCMVSLLGDFASQLLHVLLLVVW